VQVGRARPEEDADPEGDDLLDALLDEGQARKRGGQAADEDRDEDLGDDEPPPPRPGRRPQALEGAHAPEARVAVGLEGSRPPDARVPVGGRDKPPLPVADFAASFQEAAVEILVDKTVSAVAAYKVRTVLLAGGVAANLRLRARLQERLGPDIVLRFPPPVLCTDNAAMVAAAAYFRYDAGLQHDWTLDIDPNARYME
jgi:N6-L-threonylcarbamoyladenine synthase